MRGKRQSNLEKNPRKLSGQHYKVHSLENWKSQGSSIIWLPLDADICFVFNFLGLFYFGCVGKKLYLREEKLTGLDQ